MKRYMLNSPTAIHDELERLYEGLHSGAIATKTVDTSSKIIGHVLRNAQLALNMAKASGATVQQPLLPAPLASSETSVSDGEKEK